MEDDNGLELGLSLTCCQSYSKSKDAGDNSSDTRTEEGDRSSKLINDFKHFLEGGTGKLELATGSQMGEPSKPEERGLWISNDNKFPEVEEGKGPESSNKRKFFFKELSSQNNRERESHDYDLQPEVEEGKGPESSNKRKFFFEELSNQNNRERESHDYDLQERSRQSHISINTDDGSTAENEGVADSEVVGSTSRMVSHQENSGKKYNRGVGTSQNGKEVYTVFDTSAVEVSGQRGFTITPEREFRGGNVPHSISFPSQAVNILNMPHSVSAKERGGGPSVIPANSSPMFGYSSVQLPIFDKDNSKGVVFHSQQFHPSYAEMSPSTMDKLNDASSKVSQEVQKPSEAPQYSGTAVGNSKIEGKQTSRDSGFKHESDKLPPELSSITPGIAPDLQFGGSGSYPNLPWVSTKGLGPNGRTISGVTYKFSPTQIKIVCACHGSHMSPEEFVRHASEEKSTPESGTGLASLPSNNNPAASSQS